MKISELKIGQDGVDIEAVVRDIEEPRSFSKFGREIRVANATIDDGSGTVKLTLWNQDIDKVSVNDKIKVTNGFVNEFNGEKRLTSGRVGKIEVVEEGKFEQTEEQPEQSEETQKAEQPEQSEETQEAEEQAKEESIEEEKVE